MPTVRCGHGRLLEIFLPQKYGHSKHLAIVQFQTRAQSLFFFVCFVVIIPTSLVYSEACCTASRAAMRRGPGIRS